MIKPTRRVKLHTNHACNLKCRFCYYGDSANIKCKEPTFEELKEQIKIAKNAGALDIDFSGGESTIMKFFPELISYTKNLGFRDICVITNGLRMSNKDYAKKLVDSGLNNVLFSLEGYNSKTHDYLTRVPGSFDKINKAIKNAKELGLKVRINITVTKENYKVLDKFAKHILKYEPDAVNFIKFNPWDVAFSAAKELSPKYTEISPHIKKAIDILSPKVLKITIRYIPYCFMKNYEKHVCNCLHNKYDADEWFIPMIQHKMGKVSSSSMIKSNLLKKFIKNFKYILQVNPFYVRNFDDLVAQVVTKKMYTKPSKCKKCKYYRICDGIDKPYPKIFNTNEIIPVIGKKIKNPMIFREKYLEKYNEKFNF